VNCRYKYICTLAFLIDALPIDSQKYNINQLFIYFPGELLFFLDSYYY